MRNIRIKLAVFFISLMVLSSFISLVLSVLFPNSSIKKEIIQGQHTVAVSILELEKKTDLSFEEILQLTSNPMFRVREIENINELQLSAQEQKRLENAEIISLSNKKFMYVSTLLMLNGHYLEISLHPHNNVIRIAISRAGITLLSYILFGALLIAVSGRSAVMPILKLNKATQEVAKGNFDIQVINHSRDEVGQLTNSFNMMIQELKRIEYLRKDFINSVSHEFKTPLASIQGFAKLLQKGNLSLEERQEYTDIIVEETERLSRLSSNILRLSSLDNQEFIDRRTYFSLDEQIRKTIVLLEPEWSKKNISFDLELDDLRYQGDEELLQQVWINLLNNAVKFSHENGKIAVSLGRTASAVKVEISDEGIGMSEEIMLRIFERFYQGDKSHSRDGNGLGLPLVKRILELCGGSIHVTSKLHEGSTFTVELPVI